MKDADEVVSIVADIKPSTIRLFLRYVPSFESISSRGFYIPSDAVRIQDVWETPFFSY